MTTPPDRGKTKTRIYPTLTQKDDGEFQADCPEDFQVTELMGMRTHDAAHAVYETAISALGEAAEKRASLVSAMFAEIEPRDAIEAMLVAQMTATHVAMTQLSARMSYQSSSQIRESCERSMTRLSRTYLAQMDALKKHRAKAQQVVRVERVNVESGAQAIVGDVTTRGRAEDERRR